MAMTATEQYMLNSAIRQEYVKAYITYAKQLSPIVDEQQLYHDANCAATAFLAILPLLKKAIS